MSKAKLKQKMADIVEAVRRTDFNDIVIRTESGKIVMFENTQKKKL